MKITKHLVFAIFLLLAPVVAHAQTCVAVSPSGSGNHSGSDWNNAMADLPSPLVRGTTYYLADGSYGSYVDIEVAVSGTSTITIKKAVASGDYGQNCSPSIAAGWNGSTMGSGQAKFIENSTGGACSVFWIANTANTGYITVDGQVGSGENESSYGIYLQSQYNASYCKSDPHDIWIGSHGNTYSASNVNVSHVAISGSCGGLTEDSNWEANCETILNGPKVDSNIYAYNCTNCSFTHMFIRASSAVPYNFPWGNSNITLSHNFIHLTAYSLTEHSEPFDFHEGNSNVTISYNVVHDTSGSGGIVSLAGAGGSDSNFYIYGNIFYQSSGNPYNVRGYGDGVVACINGNNCPGWVFYQNTVVNMNSLNDGVQYMNSATGSIQIENNLWYGSQASATGFAGLPGGSTEDYNSFLNYANNPGGGGSHDVKNASAPTPFASWTTGNFTLASDNSNWGNRASLPTGNWNTDAAGNNFTTNRGAYQYAGSASSPTPPSNLSVVSVN